MRGRGSWWVAGLLAAGCHGAAPSGVVAVESPARVPRAAVRFMPLETGGGADLERARWTIARWFEATPAAGAADVPAAPAALPAPPGCAWVAVPAGLAVQPAVTTPLGRLVLVRTDAPAVTLDDVQSVTRAEGGAVRLGMSPFRGSALRELTTRTAGEVLLVVAGDRAVLAVRVEAPVEGDLLLTGLDPDHAGWLAGLVTKP